MKQLRVGTISVGLLFIFLGIGMLVYQFYPFSILSHLLTWWPILLILLGVEILFFLWRRNKEGSPQLTYDLGSIFVILLFGFISIGIYSFQESGILPAAKAAFLSASYEIQTAPEVLSVDQEIKKIKVLGNPQRINLEETEQREITIYSQWRHIDAAEQNEAEQKVANLIETKQHGETLFLTIHQPPASNRYLSDAVGTITLSIPNELEVETDFSKSDVHLTLGKPLAPWHIHTSEGSIYADLKEASDLEIEAFSFHGHLRENEHWGLVQEQPAEGYVRLGRGTHHLKLKSEYGLIDAQLPSTGEENKQDE